MKNIISMKLFCCLVFIVCSGYAGIKGPNYNGIRSMGMGNTTVAVTTDRTAIFHNPAGLSLLKDKIDVSISPLVVAIDGKFITLIKEMNDQGWKMEDIDNIDADFIDMLNRLDGEWVGLEYIPEITVAAKNIGFGIYTVFPVSVRIESGHFIPKLGLRGQRDLVFTWAVGVPLRRKNTHLGISVEYLQRTPLDETITTYSETFILFDEISSFKALGVVGDYAEVQHGVSFDVGLMHDFKGFRLAYDVKDLLGVIGGEIVAPPQLDLGCSYFFPQMENVKYIDNLILAFEFSDIFGLEPVSEKYEHPVKKLHAGVELDLHYAALRLGLNQGYPTAGLGLRLGLYCLDYVFFQEETGYYPGQLPRKKHVLSMGVAFKVARPKRESETEEPVESEEALREDKKAIEEDVGATQEVRETVGEVAEEDVGATQEVEETSKEEETIEEDKETVEESKEVIEENKTEDDTDTDEDNVKEEEKESIDW